MAERLPIAHLGGYGAAHVVVETVSSSAEVLDLHGGNAVMEWFILILVIAALSAGVVWNHRNIAAAEEGVQFTVAASPVEVSNAVRAAYCTGAKATLKSLASRMVVTPTGTQSFRTESRIGDVGRIEVAGSATGSTVHAHTDELYIGSPPSSHFRSGFLNIGARIVHGACKLLGVAPNAAKMKRFHAGVERKVAVQLRKAAPPQVARE